MALLDNHSEVRIIFMILLKYNFLVKQKIIVLVISIIQEHINFTRSIDCFENSLPYLLFHQIQFLVQKN